MQAVRVRTRLSPVLGFALVFASNASLLIDQGTVAQEFRHDEFRSAHDSAKIKDSVTIQEMLIWLGELHVEIGRAQADGVKAAIERFQRRNDFEPTGRLTPPQLQTLIEQGNGARLRAGFEIAIDPQTNIRIGLPRNLLGEPSPAVWGHIWHSHDHDFSVQIQSIPQYLHTLSSFLEHTKSLPNRHVTYEARHANSFVIEGMQSNHVCFYVRAQAEAWELRALIIMHSRQSTDAGCRTALAPVVYAIASTFRPFPASSLGTNAAVALSRDGITPGSVEFGQPEDLEDDAQTRGAANRFKGLRKHAGQMKQAIASLAPERAGRMKPGPISNSHEGRRHAFVAGINVYDHLGAESQLKTAVADAKAIAQALSKIGFAISAVALDVDRSTFNKLWINFLRIIEPGDTVAVFFAGHGMEIDRQNFLLPRSIPAYGPDFHQLAKLEAISLPHLLDALKSKGAKVRIVIVDSCRDRPIGIANTRSLVIQHGPAPIEPANGEFVIFSASSGQQAMDNPGDNSSTPGHSIFARILLQHLARLGVELARLGEDLKTEVEQAARRFNHAQRPAVYSELGGRPFCLTGGCSSAVAAPRR